MDLLKDQIENKNQNSENDRNNVNIKSDLSPHERSKQSLKRESRLQENHNNLVRRKPTIISRKLRSQKSPDPPQRESRLQGNSNNFVRRKPTIVSRKLRSQKSPVPPQRESQLQGNSNNLVRRKPTIVYLLTEEEILEDLAAIKKGIEACQAKSNSELTVP